MAYGHVGGALAHLGDAAFLSSAFGNSSLSSSGGMKVRSDGTSERDKGCFTGLFLANFDTVFLGTMGTGEVATR
jgi:hypothetical protein